MKNNSLIFIVVLGVFLGTWCCASFAQKLCHKSPIKCKKVNKNSGKLKTVVPKSRAKYAKSLANPPASKEEESTKQLREPEIERPEAPQVESAKNCTNVFDYTAPTLKATDGFGQSIEEKPIVVIIPSYKNEQWVERNLTSIFNQKYENYKVVYIDDCSPDNTYELAKQITEKNNQQQRTTIIHNTERCGALANLYTAIHECDDKSIIVTVDGDDWLPYGVVLAYLNEIYTEHDIWMTYGQFVEYPSNVVGYSYSKTFSQDVIEKNIFRKVERLPISHLRTFYAWLFKAIKLQDVLYEGDFYSMAWDKVMMAPMIEMSGNRFSCVSDVLYVYNNANSISDHRVNVDLQESLALYVLGLPPYEPVEKPKNVEELGENDHAGVILICHHAPQPGQIENIIKNIRPLSFMQVLYPEDEARVLFDEKFESVTSVPYNKSEFVQILNSCLKEHVDRYLFLCSDSMNMDRELDLSTCILQLKKAQVDLFYCSLGSSHANYFNKKLPRINKMYPVYAWFAQNRSGTWPIPVIDMTIWSRDLLVDLASKLQGKTLEDFCRELDGWLRKENKLGLMFSEGLGGGYYEFAPIEEVKKL